MTATGVYWQKKRQEVLLKKTPPEEVSGQIIQAQHPCLGGAEEGHVRQMRGLPSASGYML